MLTLTRLGLPYDLRKSLASTNIMESVNAVIARGWRNASMGLRWTAAGMLMAQQGFRRVNGHIHLPKPATALDRTCEERTGSKSGGGRRPTERRAGRVAGQAPPESASGAGFRPGARNAMRAPCRNRLEVRLRSVGIPECGHRKGTGKRLTPLKGIGYTRDEEASASRFQRRPGHSRGEANVCYN